MGENGEENEIFGEDIFEEEEEEEKEKESEKVEDLFETNPEPVELFAADNIDIHFKDNRLLPEYFPKIFSTETAEWGSEDYFKDFPGVTEEDLEEKLEEEKGEVSEPCTPEDELLHPDKDSSEESTAPSEALSNVYSKLSPFNITWSFGVKRNIELINLTTSYSFEVFYVSSHFGVIYNYCTNTMIFLPGHNYPISSIAADASGRWLVSADAGEDTVIIIWDNKKRLPVWSLYNVFPGEGTKRVKISQDARFLAAINENFDHTLKFWLWTYGREEPDGIIGIDSVYGKAKHIDFNHMKTEQFAVTMEAKVIFCEWSTKNKLLDTYFPEFEIPKKKLGVLRETLFLDDNHTALTSTSQGHIIVWCDVIFSEPVDENVPGTIQKKYLKAVKIQKSGITSLRLCDKIIISSSEDGVILFHDQFLRLLYWLPKLKVDPIVSVSFHIAHVPFESDPFSANFYDSSKQTISDEEVENVFEYESSTEHSDKFPEKSSEINEESEEKENSNQRDYSTMLGIHRSDRIIPKQNPSDCTVDMRPFAVRDFIFLTTTGRIGYVSHRRRKIKSYLYDAEASVLAVDCNPQKSHVVVGDIQGRIILYEYICKKLLLKVTLPGPITTLKYSNIGYSLMAGLQNGTLFELDPLLLTVKNKFEISKSPIQKICFSFNDEFLAFFDQSSLVCVYMKKLSSNNWIFLGKYISHYKPIKDIMFEETHEVSKNPRLFSIGEDRMLVEYDMKNLEENKLKILSIFRIEQTAIPCCFTWLSKFYKSPQFLISNNEYKLKVIDAKTNICQKTTVGPTADTPINFMKVIVDEEGDRGKSKMIYSTQKHIGIRILPPTGNPFEGMGMVAHPEKLVTIAISHDFKYVFTSGVNDCSLLMWTVNSSSVDIASQLGGVGLEPFVSLIEGGPNSFLFKEIEDFFYYAQIIHQGENPNLDRSVSKNLALCEIPDLFRSLGYYPTDYEVSNILHELKHLNYEKTGELTTEVSFDECVKAFLNHRPVRGVSLDNLNKALLAIADLSDPSDIIVERGELYKALEEKAEAMDHAEVVGYLCILLLPKDESNPIPPSLSLNDFAENVLGIDLSITEENVKEITHAFEAKTT